MFLKDVNPKAFCEIVELEDDPYVFDIAKQDARSKEVVYWQCFAGELIVDT